MDSIQPNTTQTILITDIKEVDRERVVYNDIEGLAESIASLGLIQPIVLNRDHVLIAGGRRLRAFKHLQRESIPFVYKDCLNDGDLKAMELEENIQRQQMTWQEECMGISKLHTLRKNMEILKGAEWGYRETAAMLQASLGNIANAIYVAKELKKKNPCLDAATGLFDALNRLKAEKIKQATAMLVQHTKANIKASTSLPLPPNAIAVGDFLARAPRPVEEDDEEMLDISGLTSDDTDPALILGEPVPSRISIPLTTTVINSNCLDYFKTVSDGFFDHVVTDPPYGIDMDNLIQDVPDTIKESHKVDQNKDLLTRCIPEFYRITGPAAFVALWCDEEIRPMLADLAIQSGFRVQRWSVIWVKEHACSNQMAQYNFTKRTEICLILRKPNAKLRTVQPTNVIKCGNDEERKEFQHPFSKPFKVWDFLYSSFTYPGQKVLDPFAGVGSSAPAAIQNNLQPYLVELDEHYYNTCLMRTKGLYENKYGATALFQ